MLIQMKEVIRDNFTMQLQFFKTIRLEKGKRPDQSSKIIPSGQEINTSHLNSLKMVVKEISQGLIVIKLMRFIKNLC